MASQCGFRVQSHVLPAQHVREFDHGVADESRDYFIHITQYTPLTKRPAGPNALTVVAAAGIGMIKEVYEPFFQAVTSRCLENGVFIRNFWIADVGCIGKSALANADNLAKDQSWFDHSRDLLHMINHFRDQMPRPLVGLGHSMGGCQIAYLSIIHPHLFHMLVLIEPAIYPRLVPREALALMRSTSRRREHWPSKSAAEAAVRDNPFYKNWHPRAVELLIENSLVAPAEHPVITAQLDERSDEVVTTTPRDLELALLLKPNYAPSAQNEADHIYPFARDEVQTMMGLLPDVRPSVCYISGSESSSSFPEIRAQRMETTGMGRGGSGGVPRGRVVEHLVPGGGHYILLDRRLMIPTAAHTAQWLAKETKRFIEERRSDSRWRQRPVEEKIKPESVLVAALGAWHPKKSPDIDDLVKSRL